MKIQFIGAAGEVTGSCTLLEVNGRYYLIDCGMEQGLDVLQNVPLPIPAAEIDAIFLTHAHIDHSGMLPRLYKEGFRGIIFATEATVMLCDIMLRDSAHIQMLDAEWKNRKAARAGEPTFEPSYDLADAIGSVLKPHLADDVSLYRLLRECCGIAVTAAEQSIEVGLLQPWEQTLLGDGAPAAGDVVAAGLGAGLLLNTTGPTTLRFLPPLVCEKAHIDVLVEKLGAILAS